MRNIKVIKYDQTSSDQFTDKNSQKTQKVKMKKLNPTKKLMIIIIPIIVLIIVGGGIALYLILKKDSNDDNEVGSTDIVNTPPPPPPPYELGPLEMQPQYKIKTEVGDLKSIYVNQIYYEDIKIEGDLTQNLVDRKTNYHIFILDEIEATNEEKMFYNKTYLCLISISSECVSTRDEYCLPRKLVDLNDQDYSHVRRLGVIDDLSNFPLPICLFNMTDNNVITSISCHRNLTQNKINSIVLDLYFFRPPGIKRNGQKEANISITVNQVGDNIIIRETNGGICGVENALGSLCTTDFNTTKDKEGNLISYYERAFTNITKDENNYFVKTKQTQLLDKTNTSELNPEKYKMTFDRLYSKLKDYMKDYIYFSLDQFKELYNISKGIKKENEDSSLRNLEDSKPVIKKEANLLELRIAGTLLRISLENNAGYNTQAMEANSILEIDGKKWDLAKIPQYSDIDRVISKLIILSKAGNSLATKLYQNIKEHLINITDIIAIDFPKLNKIVMYKELSDIFDSTISLDSLTTFPYQIIQESNNLITKFEQLYNRIDDGSLKNNIRVLNDYIYKFTKQSHILVNKISNDLKGLGDLIKSPKAIITDISTYYMNHTSTSYVKAIEEAKEILMNYYLEEKDKIVSEVERVLEKYEEITLESIQKQLNLMDKLTLKLENNNLTIDTAIEDDYKRIIVNLQNSNNYIAKINNLFKNKIRKEMGLKDGFFISQNDIESNNETFYKIFEESLNIAQNMDDNNYIDKIFDNIMKNFRLTFTSIIKDMEILKNEQFPMDENTLQGGYFKPSEQQKISKELKEFSVDIINKIKNENNKYMNTVKKRVNIFLDENKATLFQLISDLEILFSEEKIENIAKIYDMAFNGYLDEITNTINTNKKITDTYFDGMVGIMENDDEIVELFKNYPVDQSLPPDHPCVDPKHCWQYTNHTEIIYNKYITQGYINKYNVYMANFYASKEYINGELHTLILEEYKTIISKIKGVLQTFNFNKISDKYPEYSDLNFIDKHINNINNFYNRLNRYISDDKFNNYYLQKIQNYRNNETDVINKIINDTEQKHKKIKVGKIKNDINVDMCTTYKRRKAYTCTNSAVYFYDESQKYDCLNSWETNGHKKIVVPSFTANETLQNEFNSFYSSIKCKIDNYNNLITQLKSIICSIETEILNEQLTNNYLSPIQQKISNLLSEKYSDNIIQGSYNYHKTLMDERLENLLRNYSLKWENAYDILGENVNKSLTEFKYSMNEFGLVALIYEAIISQNLTIKYYDSIIEHQRTEFNYTISYYYNSFLQNVTAVYQFIINQIPINQEGFNNITNLRKEEVNSVFNKLFNDIKESKEESKRLSKQTSVLGVSSLNFFKTDSILSKIIKETSTILKAKGTTIYKTRNGKKNDEFSLASRFYLENSLNGLQIEELYEDIDNNNNFVDLNLKKFKELLSNNWIFDQDDFINKLNLSLYNQNFTIQNSFSLEKKEYYRQQLEDKITILYTKEKIAEKIKEDFENQIKSIDNTIVTNVKLNVQNILNEIQNHLKNENERLKTTATSYTTDFSIIQNTIQTYKENIINKIKSQLTDIVKDVYEYMRDEVYINGFESWLDQYLNKSEIYISECKTYESLSSSFNIGELIYNNVKELVDEYNNITRMNIEYKRDEYYEKLYKESDLSGIQTLIDDQLNLDYSNLLSTLKSVSKNQPGETGYTEYDFNDDIKANINSKFNEYFQIISQNLSIIKGDKYKKVSNGWEPLDYDKIDTTFSSIANNFETFILQKIDNEKKEINTLLKEIIRNNFQILINSLMLSFGNDFFERVIKYNENFKITSLYQNLKYSLVISLHYYAKLYGLKSNINSLTKDLKYKLYNLNNLDKISEEKNMKVLNLLNNNVEQFIEESKRHILKDYKLFLKEDASIHSSFDEKIIKCIQSNLEDISPDLENDYVHLLNENFKNKLINSYSNVMNAQTADLIQTIDDLKTAIKSKIDDLFTLDIDKVLNEINDKMNITLDSIMEYNNHFKSFEIPRELITFVESYGNNEIKPIYHGIEYLLNKETKNATLQKIEPRLKEFENNYNIENFMNQRDAKYKTLKEDNIDLIYNEIENYGKTESEYKNILQNNINKIEGRRLRILTGEETNEDIIKGFQETISDKAIDDNFRKLIISSENSINYFQSFESFDEFENTITKYMKKLNLSYTDSRNIIYNSYKDDDLYDILIEKLDKLFNHSYNYYKDVNESFTSLRKYIEDSLKEIDNLINKCANITYNTFEDKYEEISNDCDSIDKELNDLDETKYTMNKTSISENTEYNITADITALRKKAKFKFSLKTEKEYKIKKAKVQAGIESGIKPENIKFEISSPFGTCGKNYYKVEVDFGNVNYTTNLDFDTQSTVINVTTITNFQQYYYIIGKYRVEDAEDVDCDDFLGINLCLDHECDEDNPTIIESPTKKHIPEKTNKNDESINE